MTEVLNQKEVLEKRATGFDLTMRQQQVAELVCSGLSNKEIGRALGLTEGSVKQHVYSLFQKFGINRRIKLRDFAQSFSLDENACSSGSREANAVTVVHGPHLRRKSRHGFKK